MLWVNPKVREDMRWAATRARRGVADEPEGPQDIHRTAGSSQHDDHLQPTRW
jgi:hypothetical protein